MQFKDKYDRMIAAIEELIKDASLSPHEIGRATSGFMGMQCRDLSVIFSFFLDTTLNGYITGRKMDLAYALLTNEKGKLDIQAAVEISGYSDQPSFTKAFKRRYAMTPKEAYIKRDTSLQGRPAFWDLLAESLTSSNQPFSVEGEAVEEATVFGVSEHSLDLISEAMELESFYGLPRLFSNYAFELTKKTGQSLENCFKYADSLREYLCVNPEEQEITIEELSEIGDDPYYQTAFFARGITVSAASELRYDYDATMDDLMRCDMTMLNMFPGFEQSFSMSFSYYIRAYEYYAEWFDVGENDYFFDEYISLVMLGIPIEEAFDAIYPFAATEEDIENDNISMVGNDDFYEELESFERDLSIEEMADEDSRWSGERIDDDLYFDPENSGYDDNDSDIF